MTREVKTGNELRDSVSSIVYGADWKTELGEDAHLPQTEAIMEIVEKHELQARLEELETALYVYENQVPYQFALAGALGGAEKDLSEGILVEIDGSKKVVTGGVNFKLPHFFNHRITELSEALKELEAEL